MDRGLLALDVLLLLVIAGIVALWVIPSYSGVSAVDKAVEATKMAALVTPTAPAASASSRDTLLAELKALPAGDPAAGQTVFNPGGAGGCGNCHSLEPGKTLVGPSLAGVAMRAASRRPDYSAELYLYESIIAPNAYVVEGFQPGIMIQTFKSTLKPEDIANVIAFLMTQK